MCPMCTCNTLSSQGTGGGSVLHIVPTPRDKPVTLEFRQYPVPVVRLTVHILGPSRENPRPGWRHRSPPTDAEGFGFIRIQCVTWGNRNGRPLPTDNWGSKNSARTWLFQYTWQTFHYLRLWNDSSLLPKVGLPLDLTLPPNPLY